MTGSVTTLGAEERDRQWVSTFTGAQFRWLVEDGRWQMLRHSSEKWLPCWGTDGGQTIHAYPGETFEEVPA